jgi:hypothetical protein
MAVFSNVGNFIQPIENQTPISFSFHVFHRSVFRKIGLVVGLGKKMKCLVGGVGLISNLLNVFYCFLLSMVFWSFNKHLTEFFNGS